MHRYVDRSGETWINCKVVSGCKNATLHRVIAKVIPDLLWGFVKRGQIKDMSPG